MEEEYFWSVCLEEGSTQAAIWTIKNNAANVIDVSNSASWEDDETLIAACDSCLSYCIQNLPPDIKEPTKCVFGVPSSWVTDGQIKREQLDRIRLICNKLSLTPTGFVVLPEAISHFVKSQEKTPVSAVILGIYPQSLDVSIFRLGNLAGSVTVARSTDIADDVIEGLARFGKLDTTPSRFLLFDSKAHDLEDIKQSLIKADWDANSEKIKFLHTPQIEIVAPKEKMVAVCLAGASEIAQLTDVNFKQDDIVGVGKSTEAEPAITDDGVVTASELGFNIGSDVAMEEVKPFEAQNRTHRKAIGFLAVFNNFKVKGNAAKLKHKAQRLLHQDFALISVIAIFFVAIGLFVAFWFLPKGSVTILVSPKSIESHEKVVFDTNANEVDFSKRIVPAKLITTTASASKTKTTTGTKTIGTPSRGSVTFYNVGGSTTIPAGTVLNSSSLRFSLDNDVTIASASGAAQPATTKGNITSVSVGSENNLAAQTFFSIANFSSSLIQAKNEADLSGGSSQEVTAVSKDDINSLISDLTTQLTETGRTNLKSQLASGYLLVENSVTTATPTKDFDHQAGDQAATVKLTMSVKVSGLSILRKDMNDLARQIFMNQVPNGYSINDDQIDFISGTKDTDFMIKLLPLTNTAEIKNSIVGKNESNVKEILSQKIAGVTDVIIKVTPRFPLFHFLPHVADNISVVITSN